jgi:hypothetical protein
MGEGQMNYGLNRQTIFYLIFRFRNRNWNLRNRWGQTALFLAAYLMRFECVEALFRIDGVDLNIPDGSGITPLVAAIINVFVPNNSKTNMVLRFVHHPRVNVNQRGADGKLPLQIAFKVRLVKQPHPEQRPSLCILFDAFCRRSLTDYDLAIKNTIIPGLVQQLSLLEFGRQRQLCPSEPQQQPDRLEHGSIASRLQRLSVDAQFNVGDYSQCSLGELVNAIQLKIRSILNDFRTLTDVSPRNFIERLLTIRKNTQLFDDFLTQRSQESRMKLFTELQ